MSKIVIKNLSKKYGQKYALKNISCEIDNKELTVITGLKESGKTSLMRAICGLDTIEEGEVYIDGILVNKLEPKDRDMAVIIKGLPLNQNATVFENMATGMKLRKFPNEEIEKRVNKACEILGLTDYVKRLVKNLTPGQKHRVMLARAIAREPKIVIIDDTMTDLDSGLRKELCTEIIKLNKRLKINFIYITSNPWQALTMADKIMFMEYGEVTQYATPREIYDRPNTLPVATFFGSPKINLIQGKLCKEDNDLFALFDGLKVKYERPISEKSQEEYVNTGRNVTFAFRPEDVKLDDNGEVFANVDDSTTWPSGAIVTTMYSQKADDATIFNTLLEVTDQSCRLTINKNNLLAYDTKSEGLIR